MVLEVISDESSQSKKITKFLIISYFLSKISLLFTREHPYLSNADYKEPPLKNYVYTKVFHNFNVVFNLPGKHLIIILANVAIGWDIRKFKKIKITKMNKIARDSLESSQKRTIHNILAQLNHQK